MLGVDAAGLSSPATTRRATSTIDAWNAAGSASGFAEVTAIGSVSGGTNCLAAAGPSG